MEKSSSPSINFSIAASLSNCRPFACSKACLILCRVSSPFGATGRDPRVPQNRTCIDPPKSSLHGGRKGATSLNAAGRNSNICGVSVAFGVGETIIDPHTQRRQPERCFPKPPAQLETPQTPYRIG